MVDLNEKYQHYRTRFKLAMDARDLTNEAMAERIGRSTHPVTISKLRRGVIKLDDEWRVLTAAAIGLGEDVLYGAGPLPDPKPFEMFVSPKKAARRVARVGSNRTLPVYGLAAGSIQGAYALSAEPMEEGPCPPTLRNVPGAYVLRTSGTSMIPRYMPDDRLYVNPTQQVRQGDHAVIQAMRYEGSGTETWIKRFDGEKDGSYLAWQYNPAAAIAFKKRFVIHLHRVLPINELFDE